MAHLDALWLEIKEEFYSLLLSNDKLFVSMSTRKQVSKVGKIDNLWPSMLKQKC